MSNWYNNTNNTPFSTGKNNTLFTTGNNKSTFGSNTTFEIKKKIIIIWIYLMKTMI